MGRANKKRSLASDVTRRFREMRAEGSLVVDRLSTLFSTNIVLQKCGIPFS